MTNSKFKDLYLLIAGQFISQIGDKFYALALAFWVLKVTGSSSKMGLVIFFAMAPSILLGFFIGGIIYRFDRKTLLVVSDVFRGLVIGFVMIVYFLGHFNLVVIIVAQILLSIASAFFTPTVQAVIPQIVDKEHISAANAKSQLASGISMVAGPVLGGLAVSYLGYAFVFIFNAVSFVAAAVFEALMNIGSSSGASEKAGSMKGSIKEGYNYIFGRKKILIIISIVAIIHFFAGSIQVVIPVLANRLNGNGAQNLGYIETSYGLGVIAAAFLLNVFSISRKEEKTMFGGVSDLGLIFIAFAVLAGFGIKSNIPYYVVFLLISLTVIIISTAYQTILQKNVENTMAGRVFGIIGSIGNLTLPAATLVFGFLMDRYRIEKLTGICGAAIISISVLLFIVYGRRTENTV
jgi:MFS family permease